MELAKTIRAVIIALGVSLSAPTTSGYSLGAGIGIGSLPHMRDSWRMESNLTLAQMPQWRFAPRLVGFGTVYDAYEHSRAWYDSPKTWVSVDPQGKNLTDKSCKQHPEYKCYYKKFETWSKLVRPWSSTLGNMYAALGPELRRLIGEQMPQWHTLPSKRLLVTSLATRKSVEVWIADFCDCRQNHPDGPPSAWSLVDLSPQAWAALGAYKNGKGGARVKGWTNAIEVRFIP
jgi:hypothetical protein